MATMTATAVTIRLEGACLDQGCADLAFRFRKQLGTETYSRGASVLPMPESLQAWRDDHRTARKRADRASRLGYQFDEIDRSQHNDDLHAINTSLPERQGRPMRDGYLIRHNHGPLPAYPCDRHRVHTYGVLLERSPTRTGAFVGVVRQPSEDHVPPECSVPSDMGLLAAARTNSESQPPTKVHAIDDNSTSGTLVAYLTLYRCGELGLVSMILGHGDHLRNDIMYLLMAGVITDQSHHGGVAFYNAHSSGTDGLRYYKERVGFHATDIEWLL